MRWLFLVAFLLAACQPIRPEPSAFVSPLMLPGRVQRVEQSDLRMQVSPQGLPILAFTYLPTIYGIGAPPIEPGLECGFNEFAQHMALLIRTAEWQERESMVCDPRLLLAAQAHAQDMVDFRYFSHTSLAGETVNELVKRFGCEHDYGPGNYFESIAGGFPTVETALLALLASPHHRAHISGEGWFGSQHLYGVGYAQHLLEPADTKFVVLIASCTN